MQLLGVGVLAAFVAGCVSSTSVQCPAGVVCPAHEVCSDVAGCVLPEQLASCSGAADGASCAYPRVADGVCRAGLCIPAGCGNGIVEDAEICDDGDGDPANGCSLDCSSDNTCNNGVVDELVGELCDDGNTVGGDDCQPTCQLPACGDGFLDVTLGESCDEGAANSAAVDAPCRPNCQVRRCGDVTTDTGEVCDDGNAIAGDGCSETCTSDETCGNGETDYIKGELCDDGDLRSNDGCASACQPEALTWRQHPSQGGPGVRPSSLAYDSERGVIIMFGDGGPSNVRNGTWQWDGRSWKGLSPVTKPPARYGHQLAFDSRRKRVVMFGGYGQTQSRQPLDDTWEWDGSDWIERTPTTSPPARAEHAMAYDARRGVTVVYGGEAADNQLMSSVWEWNGTSWTQGPDGPLAKEAGFAFDPKLGVIVMFYGSETHHYDGTWESKNVDTNLTRYKTALAFDAGRQAVIMHGGTYNAVDYADSWRWTGTGWTSVSSTATPPAASDVGMVFDLARARMVRAHGTSTTGTYELDATTWTSINPTGVPVPRRDGAMVYDARRGVAVMFGGGDYLNPYAGTWAHDGSTWAQVTNGTGEPPRRAGHAMAYDPVRGVTVLFSGFAEVSSGSFTTVKDIWEFDGTSWVQRSPTGGPSARIELAMAYDAARGKTMVFGGRADDGGATSYNDTWLWDGTTWTNALPAASPPKGGLQLIAYDAIRQRMVCVALGETWEWDGVTWLKIQTPFVPSDYTSMTFDAGLGRVVMRSGATFWDWDGSRWNLHPTSGDPPVLAANQIIYDLVHRQLMVFGSQNFVVRYHSAKPEERCSLGGDHDGDMLATCADPDCAGICDPLCSGYGVCSASTRPRCGDGVCSVLENCRSCMADCGACTPVCGDARCESPETSTTCSGDCL